MIVVLNEVVLYTFIEHYIERVNVNMNAKIDDAMFKDKFVESTSQLTDRPFNCKSQHLKTLKLLCCK